MSGSPTCVTRYTHGIARWKKTASKQQQEDIEHRDACAKKFRARQRALMRGDTPLSLTPSQAKPSTPEGGQSPAPPAPSRQGTLVPGPSAELSDNDFDLIRCTWCRRERHPDVFRSALRTWRTCADCRLTRRIDYANQSNSHISSPPNVQHSQLPPTPLPAEPLQEPAVSEGEWGFIQNFNGAIGAIELEECLHCCERWFNLDVKEGACKLQRSSALLTMRTLVLFLHIFRL